MSKHRRDFTSSDGFTLVELLISIAVLIIIMSALGTALIAFLHNAYITAKRSTHSAGASLLATYLDRDLASVQAGDVAPTSGGSSCSGTDVTSVGSTNALVLQWQQWGVATTDTADPDPNGNIYKAVYAVVPSTAPTFQLERWLCTYQADGTTLISKAGPNVLATQLTSATAFTVSTPAYTGAGSYAPDNAGNCGTGTPLSARLKQFINFQGTHVLDADATDVFRYAGCLKGRTQ